jgi:hypothetical protein
MYGEPQAGATSLARGRPPAAHAQKAKAGQSCRRLSGASPGRIRALSLGDGLIIRLHRRWAAAQVDERDRRAQPALPGHSDGQALQAKDVVTVLEELTSIYPAPAYIRSDNGPELIAHASDAGPITAGPQRPTSSPDHRGRRLCGVVQQPVQG